MVSVWSGVTGIVHYSFLKRGEIITSESYNQELTYQNLERQSPNLAKGKRRHAASWQCPTTHRKGLGIEVVSYPPLLLTCHPQIITFSSISTAFLGTKNSMIKRLSKTLCGLHRSTESTVVYDRQRKIGGSFAEAEGKYFD